jgi:AraC family transcriptional regulator of adaptative response / methylphosphotriester-DNA alkyltransferase methyltransferase
MTEEEMWRAASQSDAAFDGAFFYAVRSTGVFCRPSCKSRVPDRKNVLFFETAADARGAGFRSCKRCRPDIPGYAPAREIAEAAKAALEAGQSPAVPGVSPRRLSAAFRETYGATISSRAGEKRLAEAKRLLAETDVPVVDAADAVGFRALSAFYRFFKRGTGETPAAYRREHRKK